MERKEWKWTLGEKCERSPRERQVQAPPSNHNEEQEKSVVSQCLLSEDEAWVMERIRQKGMMENGKEQFENRMAEREKIGQIGYNPFLTQNNYIDDLMIQDKFLRPVNAKLMDDGQM